MIVLVLLVGCVQKEQNIKLGFLGCSLSHNAIEGYILLGGDAWKIDSNIKIERFLNYNGGCIYNWHMQIEKPFPQYGKRDYWQAFEKHVNENPNTNKIWWQICGCSEMKEMVYEDIIDVYDKIKSIVPKAEIYVSSSPKFPQDPDQMGPTEVFVNKLVKDNLVTSKVLLTDLEKQYVADDNIHANEEGKLVWGQDLIDFFGVAIK